MTVDQARQALDRGYHVVSPMARPVMIWDAEFTVRDPAGRAIAAFVMADTFQPLAAGNVISSVSALGSGAKTSGGVNPGMRIADAVRVYGPAELFREAEGTGQETLRFRNQPAFLTFTPSQNAGVYSSAGTGGEEVTATYHPNAVISRIGVGR